MTSGRRVLLIIVVAVVLLTLFGLVFNAEIFRYWASQQG